METRPVHFYDDIIQVEFDDPPAREKSPNCPNRFIWCDQVFEISEVIEQWVDYARRGKAQRNMQPAHRSRAERVGSRGVGRFYFRVVVVGNRILDIYYDRAPADVDDRKGNWFLQGERELVIHS